MESHCKDPVEGCQAEQGSGITCVSLGTVYNGAKNSRLPTPKTGLRDCRSATGRWKGFLCGPVPLLPK
jgi:hypothetical protein